MSFQFSVSVPDEKLDLLRVKYGADSTSEVRKRAREEARSAVLADLPEGEE